MSKFKCAIFLLLSLVYFNEVFAGAAILTPQQKFDNGVQKIIKDNIVKYHIPGVQVSILFPNEKISRNYVGGMTTLNGVVPVQSAHMFQIGSLTKTFIATVLLMLEAENKVSLNDSIATYLPNLPSAWRPISIKQLLNHTSGIFDYSLSPEWQVIEKQSQGIKQWSMEELVSFAAKKQLNFPPGTKYKYSNTNYILVGMIIETVTGKSVESELRTRIFTPLGLLNTYYAPYVYSPSIVSRMAHGYSNFGFFPEEFKDATYFNNSWGYSAGSMISTTQQTAVFLKALLNGVLLPQKQMQEMKTLVEDESGHEIPPTDLTTDGDGLGVGRNTLLGEEIWGHSGSTFGYNSVMMWWKNRNITLSVATSIKSNHEEKEPDEAVTITSTLR